MIANQHDGARWFNSHQYFQRSPDNLNDKWFETKLNMQLETLFLTTQYQELCVCFFFSSRICTMKTRLGCLSNKSDSYSDFSEFLPPAHETTARCLKWVAPTRLLLLLLLRPWDEFKLELLLCEIPHLAFRVMKWIKTVQTSERETNYLSQTDDQTELFFLFFWKQTWESLQPRDIMNVLNTLI